MINKQKIVLREENETDTSLSVTKLIIRGFNTFVHILLYGYTITLIFICCKDGVVLFTLHVPLSLIGYSILMSESMLCFSSTNYFTSCLSYANKVFIHWLLQVIGMVFIIVSLVVAFIPKAQFGQVHFQSAHAIVGLIGYITSVFVLFGGIPTKYSYGLRKYCRPIWMKLFHSGAAIISYIIAIVSLILALYTPWFLFYGKNEITNSLCLMAIVLSSIYIVYVPMVSFVDRIKSLNTEC